MSMETEDLNFEKTFDKICEYLRIDKSKIKAQSFKEKIICACVERYYKSLGVKRDCNNPSKYFTFLGVITAQAICEKFEIRVNIAPDKFRFFRYDGYNLVEQVGVYLESESIDLAFTQAFTFLDQYTYLI